MNNLNQIIVEGNLVRDAELSKTSKGISVIKCTVAVNRTYRKGDGSYAEEVSYFDIEMYGAMADKFNKDLTKGRGIRTVGRLKQDTWTDTDGKKHSKVYIIAEHIELKPKSNKEA